MEPFQNELLDKLNEQESLFRKMLILSQDQVELLKMGQKDEDMVKRLLEMLDRRQQLMDRIDRLDKSINDLQKKDHIDKVNTIRNIINSIQANDNKCRQLAQAVLNGMGDKVLSARENKKAFQAYTSNTYHDAWFFDKKK